jgi:hypothetical protein
MPAELARRFERRSRTYEARALPTELHQHTTLGGGGENCTPDDLLCRQTPFCLGYATAKSGAEYGNCTRASGLAIRGTAPIRTPPWSEQRESNSRHRVGGPRHQPLYHARSSKILAGVTGFEPAKTGFGDQRPSHRVLTPVAVATGVEPVPPDRQSGVLPLDSATTLNLAARAGFEPA